VFFLGVLFLRIPKRSGIKVYGLRLIYAYIHTHTHRERERERERESVCVCV
jgi:hypothetical protein